VTAQSVTFAPPRVPGGHFALGGWLPRCRIAVLTPEHVRGNACHTDVMHGPRASSGAPRLVDDAGSLAGSLIKRPRPFPHLLEGRHLAAERRSDMN